MRKLIVIRRQVPPARAHAYDDAWRRLHGSAVAAGARAWRFRSGRAPDLYLEFVEWSSDSDMEQITASLRAALEQIAPAAMDVWEESP
jgi:hypothetical protein